MATSTANDISDISGFEQWLYARPKDKHLAETASALASRLSLRTLVLVSSDFSTKPELQTDFIVANFHANIIAKAAVGKRSAELAKASGVAGAKAAQGLTSPKKTSEPNVPASEPAAGVTRLAFDYMQAIGAAEIARNANDKAQVEVVNAAESFQQIGREMHNANARANLLNDPLITHITREKNRKLTNQSKSAYHFERK